LQRKRKLLRDVLLTTLPKAESASFALGYFFISGFNVIINPIKNLKKIRLLISYTTNQSTAEVLIEGFRTVRQATPVTLWTEELKHLIQLTLFL
jgi:hypothetical protein